MIPNDFTTAHEEVGKLCETFSQNSDKFHESSYNESQVRKDFLDKFFIALGWDVNHDVQTNPYEQEVKVEKNVNVAARVKKADYAFYIKPNFRDERFFVEAKKPSVQLETPDNCFQTIRYAYSSSRAAVSLLTNFKEFCIIDCRFRPDINTAANHVYRKYSYEDFKDKDKFAEVFYLFGRDSVADGSLEKFAESLPKPKGKVKQRKLFADGFRELDDDFLAKLEEYRAELAKMFKRKNPSLTSEDLTEATQRTLDRLVFIRFLEDKLIEPSTILDKFGDRPHAWKQFVAKSKDFDKTYNGIIFKTHQIIDAENFEVDDRTFLDICDDFASKYSPYHFNYIPIHILGSIYERFLGNVIVATAKQARVEAKPEVRKAGGVFYTPEYIVRYIVENTIGALLFRVPTSVGKNAEKNPTKVGTLNAVTDSTFRVPTSVGSSAKKNPTKVGTLNARTPKEVAEMRFADIACGSGSFLLGVYEYLLRWHTNYYNTKASKKEAVKDGCIAHEDGTFHLSFEQKREILVNNIYGTDIDRQAFEVTQLSLFLKLLEDETQGTKQQYLGGFRQALLPSLANNIVCGNALVDWDVTGGDLFEQLDYEKERRLNPMSFSQKFPEVMKQGGFDAIVGNPPYGAELSDMERKYLEAKFSLRNTDTACLFMIQAINISNKNGKISYIVPKPLLYASNWQKTRERIIDNLIEIVDCGKVWKEVKLEQVIYRYDKTEATEFYNSSIRINKNEITQIGKIKKENFTKFGFILNGISEDELKIGLKIKNAEKTLNDYVINQRGCMLISFVGEEGNKNVLGGKQIGRYILAENSVKGKISSEIINDTKAFIKENAILVQNIVAHIANPKPHIKIIATIPSASKINDSIILDTINQLQNKTSFSSKFIIAILNSKLISWFVYRFIFANAIRTMHFDNQTTQKIPYPFIDFNNPTDKAKHDELVRLVDAILQAKIKLAEARNDGMREFYENKCSVIERNIDEIVYDLYDLTVEERDLIENC